MVNNTEQAQAMATPETQPTVTTAPQVSVTPETQGSVAQTNGASVIGQNVPSPVAPIQPQPVYVGQPVYSQGFNDRALELTINSLNRTIDTLSRTIENLASTVEKPVDTLANTVQTLAMATAKPTVVEKIIEKPTVQTIVKKDEPQPEKDSVIEEVALTEDPIEVEEEREPVYEEPLTQEESTTGGMFSEFAQREKLAFSKKLLSLDKDIKEYFSDVHNELVSYKKVNYRISFKGITYRVGRKTLAKIVVRGKTLKLHLALDVNAYSPTIFFQQDMGQVKAYEDVPFTVKIKSERARNNAIKLVGSLAENNSLLKDEQFKAENVLKVLRQSK